MNLSRQDTRENARDSQVKKQKIGNQDEEMQGDNRFELYNQGKAEYQILPVYLKKVIAKLAKRFAVLFCRLQNNETKMKALLEHISNGTMPDYMKRQQKFIERFTEMETITALSKEFLSAEIKRLENQNLETNTDIDARFTTLDLTLKPFFDRIPALNDLEYDLHLIFECLMQEDMGTMLAKSIQDQAIKVAKQEKYLLKKEEGNAPALITKNELNKITKELSTLKLKAKLKQATKSKNVKGKPGMKKSGKPKQNARNSKDKKGNGNSKSTNANKK